jgi:hypothetical protein
MGRKRKRDKYEVAAETYFKWAKTEIFPSVHKFHLECCVSPKRAKQQPTRLSVREHTLFTLVKATRDLNKLPVNFVSVDSGPVNSVSVDSGPVNPSPVVPDVISAKRKRAGKPTTLNELQELNVIKACQDFEKIYGVLTKSILRNEARHIAVQPIGQECDNEILWGINAASRYNRVGGNKWVAGFLKRHAEISVTKVKRPIEKERAAKTQPEITLQHFRNILHAMALSQIQNAIACKKNVPGWTLPTGEGIVTRENGAGRDPGFDVLKISIGPNDKPYIEVIPLGVKLENFDPDLLIAIDEKPLYPDAPNTRVMSSLGVQYSIGSARSATWTVTPVISASGRLVRTQVITRASSVSSNTVVTLKDDFTFGRLEKGTQVDDSFVVFAKDWLPDVGATIDKPGIIIVDGHCSHLTREFVVLAMKHHCYVICEPSNLSILLQAGDNGVNAFIDKRYQEEYTTTFSLRKGQVTVDDRVMCLFRTFNALKEKKTLISHSFAVVALTGQIQDMVGHWKAKKFSIGYRYRSSDLPSVNQAFVDHIFSLQQLSLPWGSMISFPASLVKVLPQQLRTDFLAWIKSTEGDEENYGTSYTAYQLNRVEKCEGELAVRLWGAKMENYKQIHSISLSLSGRVFIRNGRFLSGDSAQKEAVEANERAKETKETEERRGKARNVKETLEAPINDIFKQLGFQETKITKKILTEFALSNRHEVWPISFPRLGSRPEQIEAVLAMLEWRKPRTIPN